MLAVDVARSVWMAKNGHLFNKANRMPIACIIFDGGNTGLKFKVLGAGYNAS